MITIDILFAAGTAGVNPARSPLAKRLLDVAGALAGLALCLPLLAAIAAAVWLADGGPALFRQTRVGCGGRPFRMLKFRSMTVAAEGREGPVLTVGGDRRITPIGRRLRRSKLDELPQLWNVLVGEMSLVGPRPEVPRYVARYGPAEMPLLTMRPGITDPASLRYRREEELLATAADPERFYVERIMPKKARINLAYASRATVWSDLAVILATVTSLARDRRRGGAPTGASGASRAGGGGS